MLWTLGHEETERTMLSMVADSQCQRRHRRLCCSLCRCRPSSYRHLHHHRHLVHRHHRRSRSRSHGHLSGHGDAADNAATIAAASRAARSRS